MRQQPLTTPLFEGHGGLENNDLLKVKELSGTFWSWNGNLDNIDDAEEQFSGMIQPNQPAGGASINIISCFHGVWPEELNQLYFLPKGADSEDPNNFFQVQAVQVGGAGDFLNQAEVNPLYDEWNTSEWGEIFTKSDYVIIRVSNNPAAGEGAGGETLRNRLHAAGLVNIDNRVINLAGADTVDFHPTRLFAFGKPGYNFVQSPVHDGFCLVSDVDEGNAVLQNNPTLVHPLRVVIGDAANTHDAVTENIDPVSGNIPILNKIATSIPLTHGMSGGPALRCEINEVDGGHIHCRFLGSVSFGGVIEQNGELFSKGLIAIPE